jgi:regulator of sirC expression with transglutaminase-like and TPR domain
VESVASALRKGGGAPCLGIVETPTFKPAENDAFATLLDDPSPVVRARLLDHFARRPEEARPFLIALAEGKNRALAWHARWFLNELRFSDPAAEFRGFIQSLSYELETGALLMARTVSPGLDAGACAEELDRLAARCRELMAEPASARERCRVINRVLYHEEGFRGNTEHYTDPLNSLLPEVLARKKGIPISLGIVYLLVARRLGMELEPVGMPGHFLVGCYSEAEPFYIDAFEQGAFRGAAELVLALRAQGIEPSLGDLAPSPVREVLARCCRNLVNHYAAAGDEGRASMFESFLAEFEAAYERNPA